MEGPHAPAVAVASGPPLLYRRRNAAAVEWNRLNLTRRLQHLVAEVRAHGAGSLLRDYGGLRLEGALLQDPDQPPILSRARCFAHAVDAMPVAIEPGQLLAGQVRAEHPKAFSTEQPRRLQADAG